MKIDISLNSIDEVRGLLREFGRTPCRGADSPTGWVSHPVADLSKEPPSVMTVATTESAHGCGSDLDIDKKNDVSADCADLGEAYARAEAVASFIIRNLLDFEAWLDGRLSGDDDATVERVRFHADVAHNGRSITMRHLTEYRNADRCKVPREDKRVGIFSPPDDDELLDFEADVVGSCIRFVCDDLGMDINEYLDRDDTDGRRADTPACEGFLRDVTGLLSRLEEWAATRCGAAPQEVLSFARVEDGCLHVHVSMPSFQPDGLTLYDNMLDLPDEAGRKAAFNLIADGIAYSIGTTFGADIGAGFSDYVNGRPSDGQA